VQGNVAESAASHAKLLLPFNRSITSSGMSSATPLGNYAHLLPPSWVTVIPAWLAEDTPSLDYGGFVVGEGVEEAILWGKSEVRLPLTLLTPLPPWLKPVIK
jgi:nicotinate-nucleotide pyrophosphorylase (carboxylating)